MSEYKKYATYCIEDFIMDDDFFNWIKHPDEESNHFWRHFLLLYPEKDTDVHEAQRFILSANRDEQFTVAERKMLWDSIGQNINKKQKVVQLYPGTKQKFIRWGMAAASITALLLLSSLFYTYYYQGNITVRSVYGQKQTVMLPDSSTIILNGNSSIRYARNFKNNVSREVWIQGEAFFSIKHLNKDSLHIKNGERFIVHATTMNIEVLGTQFNVNTRRGNDDVSLNSGSIRFSFNDRPDTLTMKPGELVNYHKSTHQYAKATINPYNYSSWVDNKLLLNNTSFATIVRLLDDNYGFKINLSDTTLLTEKLSGEIPTSNENEMIRALSKALNVSISRQENNVLIIKRAN